MRSVVALLVLSAVSGCESPQERRERAAVEAAASANRPAAAGQNLYDLPQMRKARLHRERGARKMEEAYGTRDSLQRENSFSMAWNDFKAAQDGYHDSLLAAPPRFRPVIENEIDQVAGYMRQIQRDRQPPQSDR